MRRLRELLKTMREHPTTAIALFIIVSLVGISIYTMIGVPLPTALELWNEPYDEWGDTPKYAQPGC